MKQLSETQYKENLEKYYTKVFSNNDPYGAPFQLIIQPRLLLFSYGYILRDPWINPIVKSINKMDEDGFFISALYRPKEKDQTQPYHWYVPIEEIGEYGSLVGAQENAVYSIKGNWGIICSDEEHALIGGSKDMIENILHSVPDMDKRIHDFIRMWKHYHEVTNSNLSWMPGMLTHIYGYEFMKKLIISEKLDNLLDKE